MPANADAAIGAVVARTLERVEQRLSAIEDKLCGAASYDTVKEFSTHDPDASGHLQSVGDVAQKPKQDTDISSHHQDSSSWKAEQRNSSSRPKWKQAEMDFQRRMSTDGRAAGSNDNGQQLVIQENEVRRLLQQDKAFERILDHLKYIQVQHDLRLRRNAGCISWLKPLHPAGRFRTSWDISIFLVLLFTCVVVPMRLSFPTLFDGAKPAWDAVDLCIDVLFIVDIFLNCVTGYMQVLIPLPNRCLYPSLFGTSSSTASLATCRAAPSS